MNIYMKTMITVGILIAILPDESYEEVLQHPKSKLVAAGVEATFHCKLTSGLDAYWVVNNYPGATQTQVSALESRGFFINRSMQNGITTLSLRVTATIDKNGTVMFCSSVESIRSNEAVLLVINHPPLSPNPAIENSNATTVLLRWSPPFLWPGISIEYYNISVLNSGEIEHSHALNATFRDVLISSTIFAEDTDIQTCHTLEFLISAFSSSEELITFTVRGGYIPNPSDYNLEPFDISVLFKQDGAPIVTIKAKLPEIICTYQDINFTFIVDVNSGNRSQHFTLGPYHQHGSDSISHTFFSEFERDMDYNLTLVISTVAGSIASSTYSFNSTLLYVYCEDQRVDDVYVYKLVMIMSLIVAGLTSLILLLLIICFNVSWRVEKQGKRSARRISNQMVHNPIYEGPLYESLESQYNGLNTPSTTSMRQTDQHCTSDNYLLSTAPMTPRYVEHKSQNQQPFSHSALISLCSTRDCSSQNNTACSEQENATAAIPSTEMETYEVMTMVDTKACECLTKQ